MHNQVHAQGLCCPGTFQYFTLKGISKAACESALDSIVQRKKTSPMSFGHAQSKSLELKKLLFS